MRFVFLLSAAMLGGYGLLHLGTMLPRGDVKIYISNYVIELHVISFILLVVLALFVLFFLLKMLRMVWNSPFLFARWQKRRSKNRSEQELGAGYLSLIKGDWRRAEEQLVSYSQHSAIPYVNYLAAARAAQEQGKLEQRDNYLEKAYLAAPAEQLAIGLTKARLFEKAGQMKEALAALDEIKDLGAKNPQYTAMLMQTHQQNKSWAELHQLLPLAKKQDALPADLLEEVEDSVYLNQLLCAQDPVEYFKTLPKLQKRKIANIEAYVAALSELGEIGEAEKLIRNTLKNTWSDTLVDLYGRLKSDKPEKLLRRTEGWLLARPENPHLNLAAGRLAQACNKLDDAKQFLQTAIAQGQLPQAYAALGDVFEQCEDKAKALQLYKSGMQQIEPRKQDPSQDLLEDRKSGDNSDDYRKLVSEDAAKSLIAPKPN